MKALSKALVIEASLMKDYIKSILIFFVMANIMGIIYKSPSFAISYIMVTIAVLGSSPFLLEEKAEMERFYSMIPLSSAKRVCGRYMLFLLLGTIVFIAASITQVAALAIHRQPISSQEIFLSGMAGIFILIFFISIQFPCYYKWGGTKGRLIILIPASFLIILPVVISNNQAGMAKLTEFLFLLMRHSGLSIFVLLALSSLAIAVSMFLSLRDTSSIR